MKFANGCWLYKEGVSAFAPQEIYEKKVTDYAVTICAPTHHINHREIPFLLLFVPNGTNFAVLK